MYVAIRKYTIKPNFIDEIMQRIQGEFLQIISRNPASSRTMRCALATTKCSPIASLKRKLEQRGQLHSPLRGSTQILSVSFKGNHRQQWVGCSAVHLDQSVTSFEWKARSTLEFTMIINEERNDRYDAGSPSASRKL
jgi:hypothetical protein